MHKKGLNYHDLLTAAIGSPSAFQAFIDGYFADKYNAAMWDGFSFDLTPMLNYTYQEFQAELQMNVMATFVNPDSPAKAQSTEGFSLLSGTIPTMKTALERDAKEVRDLMIAQQINGNASVDLAIQQLYKKMDSLIGSHVNSISYQRNQMVSKGKLELLDTNNPGGIKNVIFSAQIPTDNTTTKTSTTKWWTDATHGTEGSAADPIKDLKAEVRKLKDVGVSNVEFEVDYLTLEDVLNHSKVLTAIGYNTYIAAGSDGAALSIGSNLSDVQRKAALEAVIGASIKAVDHISMVEKFDKATMKPVKTSLRSFAPDVFVLKPKGEIGTIKHVMPIIPDTMGNGAIAQYFNNSLLLRVYSNINTNVQYYNTEQAVLPVINKPKYIRRLEIL